MVAVYAQFNYVIIGLVLYGTATDQILLHTRVFASPRSYLVDSASSHMLVSKIKPCMSKYMPY
jgi:hypothetical protein